MTRLAAVWERENVPGNHSAKKREPSQKERFVAAARSVGALETADAFDEAFAPVVRSPKASRRR